MCHVSYNDLTMYMEIVLRRVWRISVSI